MWFSEHYAYNDGEILDECVDFSEDFDEDTGECVSSGGFRNGRLMLKCLHKGDGGIIDAVKPYGTKQGGNKYE